MARTSVQRAAPGAQPGFRRDVGLMALLFVGGVMSLAWVAGIALLVLIEKTLPWGRRVSLGTGAALVAWGAATLATAA